MIADVSTIVAREMGVRRGGRWLLRPATFGFAGGVIGLTGSPGAGKSTLLDTFATLRRPHVGTLNVLGYDIGNFSDLRRLRARIGYLPADFRWAAGLSVHDFVAYSAYYKRISMSAVNSTLERLELSDIATMELGRLPAEVRLRAAFAATCVHDPELVLLDEPLAGMSERAADELVPLLRALAPTVVVTAPAAGQVAGWCDQIFALVRGRLTEPTYRPQPAVTGGHGRHHGGRARPGVNAPHDQAVGLEILTSGRPIRKAPAPAVRPRLERLPVGSGAGG
jgi:ABC-type multidrug transport system ATPase subunit